MTFVITSVAAVLLTGSDLTASWDTFVQKHVRAQCVDYGAIEPKSIETIVQAFGEPTSKPDLAYYLNAYNALVVGSVVALKPNKVVDVPGFFKERTHRVNGRETTLDALETMIRERYKDPRIHFALNCAAVSCPPLHRRAFRAADLDRTLTQLTHAFVRGPGVQRSQDGSVNVSRIFEWYRKDFELNDQTLQTFLTQHVTDPKTIEALKTKPPGYLDYDWSLNRCR